MKPYSELSREELLSLKEELNGAYEAVKRKGLSLNMARGKPSPDQLDLSMEMLDVINLLYDSVMSEVLMSPSRTQLGSLMK